MLKKRLRQLISEEDPIGIKFNWLIQLFILLFVVGFSVETLPDLSPKHHRILHIGEVFLVVVFSLEYLARVISAENPWKFIFSFYGLIDLIALLPFFMQFGFGFVSLRALRFLRIFRILKLMRYNKAINHFKAAFILAKEELILFGMAALILLYFSAVGIYFFEHPAQPEVFTSIFSSLWWSVCTLTTVGYGDIFPITVGGRTFTFLVLIVGLCIISVPAGILASSLSRVKVSQENEKKNNEHSGS
jgi:voltage-gated potassium channel